MTESITKPAEGRADWLVNLDAHAQAHGFHALLSDSHGALYTEDDRDVLLVTFEDAHTIRTEEQAALPYGLQIAGKEGWSHLCLYSEGPTWFRDEAVYAFFDDVVDDGFFDHFDRVVFFGAGVQGYAASAFSVGAPGASVVLVRPQATQAPALASWDNRHREARRLDFTSRYGYAPTMAEAASELFVIYDPRIEEDAMHAALFGPEATHLRCPRVGQRTEFELETMGVLGPLLRAAGKGRLTPSTFAQLYRKRRAHAAYLRHVLNALETADRPILQALWCRAALREVDRPRLRRGLAEAEARLLGEGLALPPAPVESDVTPVSHAV